MKKCKNHTSKDYIIPGWKDHVDALHTEARSNYLIWRNLGKPRTGPSNELMRRSRLQFKYALRQCQRQEDSIRADAMAKSHLEHDCKTFWKEVKKSYNNKVPLSTNVDGCTGEEKITTMWQEHYKNLLNCIKTNQYQADVAENCTNIHTNDIICSSNEVAEAIKSLKLGKSYGNDGLCSEHYRHSDRSIEVYLSLLFTVIFSHGYIPTGLMDTVIIPLVKNKNGNISDKNNYRPIALVTVMSKILEIVILNKIRNVICTQDNQFGFKKNHGTDLAIYTLKNTIDYYRNFNSPVYVCFLDASKAFDKVNHWSLFKKLLDRKVPQTIVRMLMFWYQKQRFCVKWGSSTSNYFNVGNGVRQGSILSPYLFALYIDELSVQ